MKLNYKNLKDGQSGFTIVELLIVIVVIGILAGITIVAYSGITNRANTTKAQSNATTVQSVAEAMNADIGYYPETTADFTTSPYAGSSVARTASLPAGINISLSGGVADTPTGTPSGVNGLKTVLYQYCGAVAAPAAKAATGGRIQYWDFAASTPALSTNVIYVGTGSASGGAGAAPCFTWVTPAS